MVVLLENVLVQLLVPLHVMIKVTVFHRNNVLLTVWNVISVINVIKTNVLMDMKLLNGELVSKQMSNVQEHMSVQTDLTVKMAIITIDSKLF